MLDEKRLFLMIALFLTRCVRLLVALANHTLDIHRKRRQPTLTEVVRCQVGGHLPRCQVLHAKCRVRRPVRSRHRAPKRASEQPRPDARRLRPSAAGTLLREPLSVACQHIIYHPSSLLCVRLFPVKAYRAFRRRVVKAVALISRAYRRMVVSGLKGHSGRPI